MSDKPSLFSELKRRHVDKVALVYAAVAWLLIELAWILLPTLDAPEWMLPALVVLIALGFVITVFISWSFEMTPEGMKRTADITPGEVLPYWSKRKFIGFIIGVAAIAVVLLGYQLVRLNPTLQQLSNAKRTDKIFIQGNQAGTQTVEGQADGAMRAEYSYNDRGRGDHIMATWKLDGAGVPVEYEGRGNDYMKAPIEEHFEIKNGRAGWKNRSEQGEQAITGEAFYLPMNPPPELFGVLARALLKAPNHKLALLPAGEATIEQANSGTTRLTEYRITGLGFSPQPIWLDHNGTSASVSPWFSVVTDGFETAIPQLLDAQQKTDAAWSERISRALAHMPRGDLVIRNARLFDPRDLRVTPATSVVVSGERIVRVAPDADVKAPANAEIIDAQGRFLMPGLWDNHQHFSDNDGALDLANGVTSARDMANDTDAFLQRVARFDDGSELGPRVLKAGIIDGNGEFAGPTKMRVDTAEQAIQDVDWYADHGYAQ